MVAPRSLIVAGALVVAAAAPRLERLNPVSAGTVRPLASHALASPSRAAPMVVPNDNQRSAGRVRGRALELRLVAQEAEWRPDLEAPAIAVYALAEEGKAPSIPGPLIRVRAGTTIRVRMRNALSVPMLMRGLQDRPVKALDSVLIAAGATHEFTFQASTPGTYYYWGQTAPERTRFSQGIDGQLLGALVVDPAHGPVPADRIWVLGLWQGPEVDSARIAAGERRAETLTMNGLTWPFTERLHYRVGDTIRYRIINANRRSHPMHLHGFYYTVDAAGTATADTIYAAADRRLAVTERMVEGGTFAMTWVPTRAGNWLFHCHLIAHVTAARRLAVRPDSGHVHGKNHVMQSMAGLVVGIVVEPRPGQPPMAEEPAARRKLRVFVTERPDVFGPRPGYSYVLQEGPQEPATDSLRVPSSPIFLTRGEPTEITVINRSKRAASVHWHGIELESFYDGVGDWSGYGSRTAPPIAPGDSFVARLTPDRAGTFIYHTHSEEGPLLVSGLYGSLIILEPGERHDPETDRVFLLGNGGPLPNAPSVVNGRPEVEPLALKIGTTYRLRFINITPNDSRVVRLVADTATLMRWKLFAKDGATLPAHQATERASRVVLGPGETYDFEFTPRDTTRLTLDIFSATRRTRIAVSATQ